MKYQEEEFAGAPSEIGVMFWKCQLIASLKSQIKLLEKQIEQSNEKINALEIKADFYRRQVILESRYGMMLEKSFS